MKAYSKIAVFNDLIANILKDVQRQVENDITDAPAMLAMFALNEDYTKILDSHVKDVSEFHEDERGKEVLSQAMDRAINGIDSPITGLLYVSEAWMLRQHMDDERPTGRIADNPDRQEALIILARTKLSTEVITFNLDRKNKTVTYMEDQFTAVSGRMVGTPVDTQTVH